MNQFEYQAVNSEGERMQGLVEARDEDSAVKVLRDKGLIVVSLKDPQTNISYKFKFTVSKVSSNDLIAFTRQMAAMLNSGLPIVRSLQIIKKEIKNPVMNRIVEEISVDIESGQSFHAALKRHPETFSTLYLALVKAGELAGVLGEIMERLATNLDRDRDFRGKVKSAMLYPSIVLAAMVGVGFVMIFFVMPKMAELFESFEADLPLSTKIFLGISSFLSQFWFLALAILIMSGVGLYFLIQSPQGKRFFDSWVLNLPVIGDLQQKVTSTNIIRTLAILNNSGVSIVESLNITSQVSNNMLYREALISATKKVEKGVSLADSLTTDEVFPEGVTQMILVGEETGKLSEMLEKIAIQYEKDSLLSLKTLTSAIEPTLIIVLGVGVGIMVVSIIFPIYSLTSSI